MKSQSVFNTLLSALYATASTMYGALAGQGALPTPENNYQGLTSDVFVKQIHSHNDYFRARPLLNALSLGCQSVEADIWNFEDEDSLDDYDNVLYVGHNLNLLYAERTLDSLYLDPLYTILQSHNPDPEDTVGSRVERRPAGVFETDITATLFLFIDFKTDGRLLFRKLADHLQRFHKRRWLTEYNSETGEFVWGPITVIGTGSTPLEDVQAMTHRYIFFDGPLGRFNTSRKFWNIDYTVSPIASASLKSLVGSTGINGLSEHQQTQFRQYVDEAHKRGIKTRVWDTPWWPVSKQVKIWRQLLTAGSDFLNADDLQLAAKY